MTSADFHVRLAETEADLRAAQRLRYEVFVQELGGAGALVDHAERLERDALESRFAAAIDPGCLYITPDCDRMDQPTLVRMMEGAHGTNPDFRIAISDVRILRDLGDTVLAAYVEWQKGAKRSAEENGRFTTVLMTKATPHRWLHIHETWLPEAEQEAGPYDF